MYPFMYVHVHSTIRIEVKWKEEFGIKQVHPYQGHAGRQEGMEECLISLTGEVQKAQNAFPQVQQGALVRRTLISAPKPRCGGGRAGSMGGGTEQSSNRDRGWKVSVHH